MTGARPLSIIGGFDRLWNIGMPQVTLTGFLLCRSLDEADRVSHLLADHIRLTRAESGCLVFEVLRSMSDPARFAVREIFACRADLDAHMARVRTSDWGRATRGIPRDYVLTTGGKDRRYAFPSPDPD